MDGNGVCVWDCIIKTFNAIGLIPHKRLSTIFLLAVLYRTVKLEFEGDVAHSPNRPQGAHASTPLTSAERRTVTTATAPADFIHFETYVWPPCQAQ